MDGRHPRNQNGVLFPHLFREDPSCEFLVFRIVLDIIYVGMFITAELYLTAILYVAFTALAVYGWLEWRTSEAQTT